MSEPIDLSGLIAKQAQKEIKQEEIARQITSESRLLEDLETGINLRAAAKAQERYNNRARPLQERTRSSDAKVRKVQQVKQKAEEDLAQRYNQRNAELPADRLRNLRASLRNAQTPQQILNLVNKAFSDPTLADEALEFLERTTQEEMQQLVSEARKLLNEQKGREVIAGRNVDSVAKSFHKKGIGSSPSDLRALYRDITGNPREHNALFNELSDVYSFDQLKLVIAFLLKGLGYDLKSKGPSIQQAELLRLMTDVRNLQSILWVYLFFRSRMKLIRSLYNYRGLRFSKSLTFEKLAKQFIKFVEERYPSVLKLLKQTDDLDLEDLEKSIILEQFRDAIREVSERLYKTTRHKQNLLLVILETLEELEEEEEEEKEEEKAKTEKKEKRKKL